MQRLRQEILDKVGLTRCPTFDDIRDLKYLRAVLNGQSLCLPHLRDTKLSIETLRLYPVVPFNLR